MATLDGSRHPHRRISVTGRLRIFGLLLPAAAALVVSGQSPSGPAPVTIIRDNAWTSDATNLPPGIRSNRGSPRLTNMSIRAQAGTGANAIIAGATVRGAGNLPVLVRAIGPGLAQFGVTGYPRNVNLEIYRGPLLSAQTNATGLGIAAASTLVGSFPLMERTTSAGASDAALLGWVPAGTFTAHATPATETSATSLLEFYDGTTSPAATSARFVNLSARARVGPGDGVVVVGFVVTGEGNVTLLLRGIGPTLAQFGLTGWLRDPSIELYSGSTRLAGNTDWRAGDASETNRLEEARVAVGAFPLTSTSDAALLITLPAGAYTLQVRGAGTDSGLALAEIHEVSRTELDPNAAQIRAPATTEIRFSDKGTTGLGDWSADVLATPSRWTPGAWLNFQASVRVPDAFLSAITAKGIKVDAFLLLLTAERTFDADGILRLPSDEKMSTLLTPTGLPIEGGVQGAVTTRFGYRFRTPVDELVSVPLATMPTYAGGRLAVFNVAARLPDNLPPGIYRLRLDYGFAAKTTRYNLNGESFATRGFPKGPCDTETYSPPVLASAPHVSGRMVDATTIKPRVPWVLLNAYNSNGYRGVIAEEDRLNFGLSSRNLIQDDVILPRFNESSPTSVLTYSLEPQFPTDTIFTRQNIPWDYTKGELTMQITQPDGKVVDLGTAPFAGNSGVWPTTRNGKFTARKPPMYGQYTVRATGWTQDVWGNRYEGGGTYKFWIAKRITLATATFQGQSYPVGNRYGRDTGFAPAVPAQVNVTASLFVNSDRNNVRTITYAGKASAGGIFGTAQGVKPLPFDAPGEYLAHVSAQYTDADGHLWVQSMHHAGVVYPLDTPIVAHGKKLSVKGTLLDRGDTQVEGWTEPDTGVQHLEHINFPYNAGDVLLIATEQQTSNKIEPVLTWADKVNPAAYDSKIQGIGLTNIRIQTSNGYSPHLFPEYITDWQYYYAAAPRPGFMGRFIVSEDGSRAPYWHLSPQTFGGQIGASSNGDSAGEIYRLLGGVVIRNRGQAPQYAGYQANAFTIPAGTKNNRVIAPGAEDLLGSTREKARVFLAMNARPGMAYDLGTTFAPAFQIDPMLPVAMKFTLYYPDGRQAVSQGSGDASGSWAGAASTLDVPGVYRYTVEGEWNGYKAVVPGLPKEGGLMFVIEPERPASAPALAFNLPPISKFDAAKGIKLTGTSTAATVTYAAVIPGAVIGQGTVPVTAGKFEYLFDPAAINRTTPTYDTVNVTTKLPELADVVHFTFYSQEKAADGKTYGSFVRLIIRGNTLHYTH
jgi:hypothetical protein